jgi:hypothetical protein
MVNRENSIEEEIKERIVMGNKAFHANAAYFKSKLTSTSAKLGWYDSVIKPVLTYACETLALKEYYEAMLLAFERKILKKSHGPAKETDNTCRIRRKDELYHITGNRNISNFIRHAYRMNSERLVNGIYK